MERDELLRYWMETAERDCTTMQHLYDSGDYAWCLFVGHLVIEKLLKACYVKRHGKQAPPTHNLVRLAELASVETGADTKATLARLMQFQIRARYPDIKQEFYKSEPRRIMLRPNS